ncbi:MAG TPA: YetF domain-containing protein [Ornithinimicrobium sp.]|uniref:DUF421 domain-containing protein n=1 Tax=Ornithinimicrobium sp. TaxID=1977084 RepID=UPI002B49E020|nr:YetF domain-containing protein [Ornithinimicrobium sp.]HKJ12356.1 YetF domain-containing protein [Ornithinimicrobium sp.]
MLDFLDLADLSLWDLLAVTPKVALAVVVSTVAMYLAMVLLVRLVGPRLLAGMSGFDLAALIAFGAIIGRTALGLLPTLGSGLIALATLVVLQSALGLVRGNRLGFAVVDHHPVLLMAGERLLPDNMARAHVMPTEVQSRLRMAGVRNAEEVAAVILETNGSVSVLKRGELLEPQLLSGVVGASEVPAELMAEPS